jgi:2',3'-cyclic-nucleotide 2'-phosphodiesterase (5'-nucleotidase family)
MYRLVTSDYLANGGDQATMLANPLKRINTGAKIREVITDYVRQNSPLNLKKEGRIKNLKSSN